MNASPDEWHRWLLDVRYGGDPEYRDRVRRSTHQDATSELLDRAALRPEDRVLDIGTGDGIIGFGALDRIGPRGRVVFSDTSQDMLDHCRSAALASGELDRSEFVLAAADSLDAVADRSVDVVTARAVLMYVHDKQAAFSEFYRVLVPGGRVCVVEPINSLMRHPDGGRFFGYDVRPVGKIAVKVISAMAAWRPDDTAPMVEFDDRTLLRLAEAAGFDDIVLSLRVSVQSTCEPCPWSRFLRMSGNPYMPPLEDILAKALAPAEIAAFTAHLRPLVEGGLGKRRLAFSMLSATVPA
jgi:ubiquinone/menaquinone biosynthesis C-methylase UbiE